MPVLHTLALNPDLWNENDLRTRHHGTAHAEADDIWLLFNRVPENPAEVVDDTWVVPYRGWEVLSPLRPLVLDLMRRVEGVQLGRVMVTRLRPGARIAPHTDQGAPAEIFTRYQIALQSLPGALFQIEDETVNFRSGDVWWIDNRAEHSVINNSADDRIVCIVDVRRP
jgi:quercetin dioxygenase-like cupin family protein